MCEVLTEERKCMYIKEYIFEVNFLVLTNQPIIMRMVLFGMLSVTELVKIGPVFYGFWEFVTVFTRTHHWSFF